MLLLLDVRQWRAREDTEVCIPEVTAPGLPGRYPDDAGTRRLPPTKLVLVKRPKLTLERRERASYRTIKRDRNES
jgi:hypothetical protein